METYIDVAVIGAGISGISAASHLKRSVQIKALKFLKKEVLLVVHGIYLNTRVLGQTQICLHLGFHLNLGKSAKL